MIKESTTSMTAVPKPLKYLRPQFDRIKKCCELLFEGKAKKIDSKTKVFVSHFLFICMCIYVHVFNW